MLNTASNLGLHCFLSLKRIQRAEYLEILDRNPLQMNTDISNVHIPSLKFGKSEPAAHLTENEPDQPDIGFSVWIRIKQLSEPVHDISNNVVCATSKA